MAIRTDGDAVALLASPVRRRLVDTLAIAGDGTQGLTAGQLAQVVGLHVTTVRFHLDQLVAAGLLGSTSVRHRGAGRPRKLYALRPGALGDVGWVGDVELLRLLDGLLAQGPSDDPGGPRPTPADLGRRWAREHVPVVAGVVPADTPGRWLGKVGQMIDVLEMLGYTARLSTAGDGRTATVALTRCPFIDLARDNPAVVCGIHRGLITGVLEQLGEDRTDVGLQPFVEPTLCLAQITTTAPFRRSPTKEHP